MCQRENIGTITVHGLCSAIKVKVKDPVMSGKRIGFTVIVWERSTE